MNWERSAKKPKIWRGHRGGPAGCQGQLDRWAERSVLVQSNGHEYTFVGASKGCSRGFWAGMLVQGCFERKLTLRPPCEGSGARLRASGCGGEPRRQLVQYQVTGGTRDQHSADVHDHLARRAGRGRVGRGTHARGTMAL